MGIINTTNTPIDISNIPDLMQIVHEMQKSKQPRILQEDSTPVAMLIPMTTAADAHKTFDQFDFQPLEAIKASLQDAHYPEAEVNDMLEALSELPQYAGKGIRKSK